MQEEVFVPNTIHQPCFLLAQRRNKVRKEKLASLIKKHHQEVKM